MKWITREHPRVDRVACPWIIEKFVGFELPEDIRQETGVDLTTTAKKKILGLNLARLYMMEKNNEKAKEVLLALLKLEPQNKVAQQTLEMLQ